MLLRSMSPVNIVWTCVVWKQFGELPYILMYIVSRKINKLGVFISVAAFRLQFLKGLFWPRPLEWVIEDSGLGLGAPKLYFSSVLCKSGGLGHHRSDLCSNHGLTTHLVLCLWARLVTYLPHLYTFRKSSWIRHDVNELRRACALRITVIIVSTIVIIMIMFPIAWNCPVFSFSNRRAT